VEILKPYSSEKHSFSVSADVQLQDETISLEFSLQDPQGLFEVPAESLVTSGSQTPRRDELWKATCFEAFLNPVGAEKYYEFNFSFLPAWNVYVFENYRHPQPPPWNGEFLLKNLKWNPMSGHLSIDLENKTQYRKFQVGLTAILAEKNGAKHYYALAHKGAKPDFHLRESFTLIRSASL